MSFEKTFYNVKDYFLTSTLLGEGTFGKVYIAEKIADHSHYAIKLFNIDEHYDGSSQVLILCESDKFSNLNHPSIAKFYGINFQSFSRPANFQPSMLTEFFPNKPLSQIIYDEWTPTQKYIVLLGIANAMKYLHTHNIFHGDLKPDNIFLDDNNYPKICDYGLVRCFPDLFQKSIKSTMQCQTDNIFYIAPEVFNKNQFGPETDVYAFAFIMYEIFTGNRPFSDLDDDIFSTQFLYSISSGRRPSLPENMPTKTRVLIEKCWNGDPKGRPTFDCIFGLLKFNLSFSPEIVDEAKIKAYVDMIENAVYMDEKKKLEDKLQELMEKTKEYENNSSETNQVKTKLEERIQVLEQRNSENENKLENK